LSPSATQIREEATAARALIAEAFANAELVMAQ
jgi:hypothetical protein